MSKKAKKGALPPELEEKRTRVKVGLIKPENASGAMISGKHAHHLTRPAYPWPSTNSMLETCNRYSTATQEYHGLYRHLGVDQSFDFDEFVQNFRIAIRSISGDGMEMVFDVVGIDPPIANALRRIMIAEVPTMAIEHVYIQNNTSIMQDEVLAHRLGLIPIQVDPRLFEVHKTNTEHTEADTLRFDLKKECTRVPGSKDFEPEEKQFVNSRVVSGDLVFMPVGEQLVTLGGPVKMVHDDIIITKLRPNQAVELSCFCFKGVGKDHAKYSPVSTASYRLKPDIVIHEDIVGEDADRLVAVCPMNVYDIEEIGKKRKAVVRNPDNCSMCRECIRHPQWEKKIDIRRVKDHYIFSIESTGALKAKDIFEEAIKVFLEKINMMRTELASSKEDADTMDVDQ